MAHTGGDEFETRSQMEAWMRRRRLLQPGKRIDAHDYRRALNLRDALRNFLQLPAGDRRKDLDAARRLTVAAKDFPLALVVTNKGAVTLQAASGSSALGCVVAEMYGLAKTDRLARLKTCASEECRWIFFDRSKPANRHWCASNLCGNCQKDAHLSTQASRTVFRLEWRGPVTGSVSADGPFPISRPSRCCRRHWEIDRSMSIVAEGEQVPNYRNFH